MQRALPAIRDELVFQDHGGRQSTGTVVVKDPVARRYFNLSPLAACTAKLLDGKRTTELVATELASRFGEELSAEEVAEFVEQLGTMGLLVGSSPARIRGPLRSILAFQIHLLDPGRLLGWLDRRLGFLFTRTFFALGTLAILAAVVACLVHWGVWSFALRRGLGWQSLLTIYLPALAMMALHETAHGLACRHLGCMVRDMGIIFYYFQPCTYCDVSDSWMLPPGQRITVMLAGSFLEAVVWAVAVFLLLVLPAGSIAAEVTLGIVATSGLKCVFNLNPLIKLDGYYVLSDLLGLPNLRSTAFGYLGARLRGRRPSLSRAHRLACLVYAPLALLYSAALIGWIGHWSYVLLAGRFGDPGRLAFVGLLALVGATAWWLRRH
jgi:putative peptide zinc metalloprotease protein